MSALHSPRTLHRNNYTRLSPQEPEPEPEPEYSPLRDEARLPREEVRVSMGRAIAAWGYGAAFANLTSGVVYAAFARAIGANDFIFGILAGALPLMSFLQVLAARLIERSGKRKRQMMITGLVGRSLWIVAALVPLCAQFFPDFIGRQQVLGAVIGCILLSGAFQAFTTPAFFSWMTDLVPSRVRPMFLARRITVGTWIALFTVLASGLIADFRPQLSTYCVLLALAGVCGVLDIAFFFGVREPRAATAPAQATHRLVPRRQTLSLFDMVRVPLQDAPTRRFLLFIALYMFGVGMQGPFLWLHSDEYLHLSKTATGVLLNGIPLIAVALSMRFWGDVIRRYGTRPVMRFCSMGTAFTAFGWLIARPGAWDVLPILLFVSGSMGGALDLSAQNLITGLSPHIPRSSMTAIYSITAGLSFAFAAWCGGALAQSLTWLNDGHYYLFGLRLVNYHILFFITVGARLINATFIAPLLQEPEAVSTVDAFKEVIPEVAQSFAARFTRPLGVREQ